MENNLNEKLAELARTNIKISIKAYNEVREPEKGKYINSWDTDQKDYICDIYDIGQSIKDSLQDYLENELLAQDKEEIDLFIIDETIGYSLLVDTENIEASPQEIEKFQRQEIELYLLDVIIDIRLNGASMTSGILKDIFPLAQEA